MWRMDWREGCWETVATAQASPEPEPSGEGWADMRKSIGLNCTDSGTCLGFMGRIL